MPAHLANGAQDVPLGARVLCCFGLVLRGAMKSEARCWRRIVSKKRRGEDGRLTTMDAFFKTFMAKRRPASWPDTFRTRST